MSDHSAGRHIQGPTTHRSAATGRPVPLGLLASYPILDADGETAAVRAYQRGMRARALLDNGHGTAPDATLRGVVREGTDAVERLVGSMYHLTVMICREQAEKRYGIGNAGPYLDDLIGEAFVVVLQSAVSYDPSHGVRFHTWAARKVRHHIRGLVTRGHTPISATSSWNRLRAIATVEIAELRVSLGRHPTQQELSEQLLRRCLDWAREHLTPAQLKLPPEEHRALSMAKLRKQGMLSALKNLDLVLAVGQEHLTLDSAADPDGRAPYEFLADPEAESRMYARVDRAELRGALVDALRQLRPIERDILLYRHGFVDGETWTYAQIGAVYRLSGERMRQIERQALDRLASTPGLSARLRAYLTADAADPVAEARALLGGTPRTRFATEHDLNLLVSWQVLFRTPA